MSYCIYVSLSKPGQVQVTLNFPPPYVPWTFIGQLGAGPNCIPWDGTDGNGTPIPNGSMVTAQLNFFTGLTHLPLIDVEHHNNGFHVYLVRPTTKPNGQPIPDPKIYWDDVLLTDPWNSIDGVQNLTGCQPTLVLGCHRWQNRGTNNANPEVINTWWYTNTEEHTFVLEIDPTRWKVFSEIQPGSCNATEGVTIHLWFSSEIPLSSVLGNIATTPAGLLGSPPDTLLDGTSQPGWIHMYLTYPVIGSGNGVVITYNVVSNSSKYPYCRDTAALSCVILAVTWGRELVGEVLSEYNRLSWETAQEGVGTYFVVERSIDARQFVPIGTVMGRGAGSTYRYEDRERPPAERWFYRLQARSPGNSVTYSRTVELVAQPALEISVDGEGYLHLSGPDKLYTVEVYNPLGRLVWMATLLPGRHFLPVDRGVYVVRVADRVIRFFR